MGVIWHPSPPTEAYSWHGPRTVGTSTSLEDSSSRMEESKMPVSRNAQLLKFLVARNPSGVGNLQLMKFAYLCDLESRKLMGKPISDFDYIWYDYGPFDKGLYAAITELTDADLAVQSEVDYGSGIRARKVLVDRGEAVETEFSPAELEVMSFVANRYMSLPLDTLLNVVYDTEPMAAVENRLDALDMASCDGLDQQRIGFEFEAIVNAEREARVGLSMLASEFFDGLRSEALQSRTG